MGRRIDWPIEPPDFDALRLNNDHLHLSVVSTIDGLVKRVIASEEAAATDLLKQAYSAGYKQELTFDEWLAEIKSAMEVAHDP